jgi:flavin reductase (DIM6/NTAB) family NADH-FMN oxidoreductase RutF
MDCDHALKKLTTGIYIVTAKQGLEINGMVASWVSQVSFVPPLIMVAIKQERYSHAIIAQEKVFAVNVLSAEQHELIPTFKGRNNPAKKFLHTSHEPKNTGAPIIKDALAYLDCKLIEQFTPGDHTLFIGEVVEGAVLHEGVPLASSDLEHIYGGLIHHARTP